MTTDADLMGIAADLDRHGRAISCLTENVERQLVAFRSLMRDNPRLSTDTWADAGDWEEFEIFLGLVRDQADLVIATTDRIAEHIRN